LKKTLISHPPNQAGVIFEKEILSTLDAAV
jgi:hypothetical protein